MYMPSESGWEVKLRTLKNKCKHAPLHATATTITTTTITTRVEKPLISTSVSQKNTPFKSFPTLEVEIFLQAPRWIPASHSNPMFSKHTQRLKTYC